MAKNFSELRAKMTPEQRERVESQVREAMTEMPLQSLRRARGLTQAQLAQTLSLQQATVSKLEHQADMYVSTLRRFIEALGGRLRIVAELPEGDVEISQFREEAEETRAVMSPPQRRQAFADTLDPTLSDAAAIERPLPPSFEESESSWIYGDVPPRTNP